MLDISAPPSPVKSTKSSASQVLAEPSMPSCGSVATANTEVAEETSPSTRASSVEEDAPVVGGAQAHPKVANEGEVPYIHGNLSEDFTFLKTDPKPFEANSRRLKAMSVYGPDMLAKAHANAPGMNGTLLQMTSAGVSEEDEDAPANHGEPLRDLRSSRSQSRLKGLRFWKKKQKAGEGEVDQSM
ncbi:hypothetical protein ANO11243_005790 [Dothideomycetidae sp. 11243]|nr:hypothetical protein ANO11243_005790 [fungal sp. No.11243]